MRWLAVALVAVVMLTSCGTDQQKATPSGDGAPETSGTALVISVVTDSGVEPRTMQLICDPTDGDHPNGDAACASLAAAGSSIFEPVPDDQACTKIYGGPQTATITGVFEGTEVDASFNRSGGCEIDRWDTLGTEVFDVPML